MSVKSRIITATRKVTMQIPVLSQKLASILVICMPIIDNSGKKVVFKKILYIHYPI